MPQYRAGCTGKAAFASWEMATKVRNRARRSKRRRDKAAWSPEVYHCPVCRQWHMGRSKV